MMCCIRRKSRKFPTLPYPSPHRSVVRSSVLSVLRVENDVELTRLRYMRIGWVRCM